jgi:hypothetical protein
VYILDEDRAESTGQKKTEARFQSRPNQWHSLNIALTDYVMKQIIAWASFYITHSLVKTAQLC